ncbi:MAG TPA: cysteine desulfurase family protein [Candidatus Megaira endosymbiont of Nemacystus decipiens]|nr:cysteine desulfurase family protein [Candidatus Megaera endosymbiont of Nemacystus decipiens]
MTIYLDHNSTTDVHLKVKENIGCALDKPLNPSSIHKYGRSGKSMVEHARSALAKLLGFNKSTKNYNIVFTSSGTEANNMVINNFIEHEIYVSAIEHHSVYDFSKKYSNVKLINVDENGIINFDHLEFLLSNSSSRKKLVSVMLANNETGIIQPIKQISDICHKYQASIHTDAVQAIGKIPVNILDLDVDFLTISAHKFGGIVGSGALIYKSSFDMRPLIIGGGQEKNLRSGTENLMGIVALGVASDLTLAELKKRENHLISLRSFLENQLITNFDDIHIVGKNKPRLPNTCLFINKKLPAQLQIIALDMNDICVSSGSACSSGKVGESHVLSAMKYKKEDLNYAIRISLGMSNSKQDVEKFLEIYKKINKES